MRIVLKLGAHKTGCSALQGFLNDNSGLLQTKGIAIAKRKLIRRALGWGTSEFFSENFALFDQAIAGELANARKAFLVVNENALGRPVVEGQRNLYPLHEDALADMHLRLKGHDTKIVYHIRSQDDFLESYYLQTIYEGAHHTFGEWISAIDLEAISWVPAVRLLQEQFGKGNVIVRDYSVERAKGQEEFLGSFLRTGHPKLKFGFWRKPKFDSNRSRSNASISARGLDIALAANKIFTTKSERRALKNLLKARFSNKNLPRPQLFSPQLRSEIRSRYEQENAALTAENDSSP